jgi:hypothetical protein
MNYDNFLYPLKPYKKCCVVTIKNIWEEHSTEAWSHIVCKKCKRKNIMMFPRTIEYCDTFLLKHGLEPLQIKKIKL